MPNHEIVDCSVDDKFVNYLAENFGLDPDDICRHSTYKEMHVDLVKSATNDQLASVIREKSIPERLIEQINRLEDEIRMGETIVKAILGLILLILLILLLIYSGLDTREHIN